jgi:hypothetical protein
MSPRVHRAHIPITGASETRRVTEGNPLPVRLFFPERQEHRVLISERTPVGVQLVPVVFLSAGVRRRLLRLNDKDVVIRRPAAIIPRVTIIPRVISPVMNDEVGNHQPHPAEIFEVIQPPPEVHHHPLRRPVACDVNFAVELQVQPHPGWRGFLDSGREVVSDTEHDRTLTHASIKQPPVVLPRPENRATQLQFKPLSRCCHGTEVTTGTPLSFHVWSHGSRR